LCQRLKLDPARPEYHRAVIWWDQEVCERVAPPCITVISFSLSLSRAREFQAPLQCSASDMSPSTSTATSGAMLSWNEHRQANQQSTI